MLSTSKSNRQKSKKLKIVPKPKQECRVQQPTRNWLELPSDLMVNILQRVGVIEVLENAQKVCTAWREICKDPAMWRVIHMDKLCKDPAMRRVNHMESFTAPSERHAVYQKMCKHVVDRSQGQLVDLRISGFCDRELFQYVADRSSQLRRLEILFYWGDMYGIWGEAFKKLPLLEELSFGAISQEDIEAAGRYCPLLKTLKMNQETYSGRLIDIDYLAFLTFLESEDDEEAMTTRNDIALAVGKNLPQLTHLELIGNITNIGLESILDGCCHLRSLDLSRCLYVHRKGDLWKRCLQQIKDLKLPYETLEGYWGYLAAM
ncbi:hypothetical protein SSX86_006351 [Deinandra increscens subsp. villosa]|uniref:F-box domain-containing protein n=1 Tax=Deinandra increscens subsp. villosa TaxID=3103831 RepID=A0AAP0DJC6_9ASTR